MAKDRELTSQNYEECILEFREILQRQMELFSQVIFSILSDKPMKIGPKSSDFSPSISRVLIPMLNATLVSYNTLLTLSKEPGTQTRDCYSVSRSILESIINMAYMAAEGDLVADRAFRHCSQKAYRDMDRTSRVGEQIIHLRYEGKIEVDKVPGLRKEIEEFTSKSGREKGWTDLSVDERMERIGKTSGDRALTMLHFARFGIYRRASEIIHGTLFGAAYMLGLTNPDGGPRSAEEVKTFLLTQLFSVLFSVIMCGCALITCLDRRYGFPDLVKTSDSLLTQMIRASLKDLAKDKASDGLQPS